MSVSLGDSLHFTWSSLCPSMLLWTAHFNCLYGWEIFPYIFGSQLYLFDVDGHLGCFCCFLLVLMWSQAWPNAVSQSWGEEVIESGWYCLSHSRLWAWSEPSKLETWLWGWRFFGPRAWIPIHRGWSSTAAQGSAWKPQNQCKALTRHRPEGSQWLGGGRVALELFHAGRDSALSGLALTRFLVLGGLSWLQSLCQPRWGLVDWFITMIYDPKVVWVSD